MQVLIDEPEAQLVLRLRKAGHPTAPAVVLSASIAGSAYEQDILYIESESQPSPGDPLAIGRKNDKLTIRTLKLRSDFPAKLDGHGHIEIGMKA